MSNQPLRPFLIKLLRQQVLLTAKESLLKTLMDVKNKDIDDATRESIMNVFVDTFTKEMHLGSWTDLEDEINEAENDTFEISKDTLTEMDCLLKKQLKIDIGDK